jgi:hypothetical protein
MPDIPERPEMRKPIKAPTNFKVETVSNGAHLEWSSVTEATSYLIYRSNEKGGKSNLIYEVNVPSHTDTEIQDGGVFFYRVKSKNAKYTSIFSEEKEISLFREKIKEEVVTIISKTSGDGFEDIFRDISPEEEGKQEDVNIEEKPVNKSPDTKTLDHDWGIGTKQKEPITDSSEDFEEDDGANDEDITPVEITYDEDASYFFTFGVKHSGKSVMISAIIYNILAHRIGDRLVNINDDTLDYQLRGTKLFNEMVEGVSSGKWIKGTAPLRSENYTIPRQINLDYQPKKRNSKALKFALMDFSGEDLMKLRPNSENRRARLAPGIEAFLALPKENLIFICVYPAELTVMEKELHSSYILNFFNEIDRLGLSEVPIVAAVTKWDLVKDKYESAAQFMAKNDRIIWSKLNDPKRNSTLIEFSVGEVLESGKFKFDPRYANKLFEWMYYSRTGDELGEPAKKKWWKF